ncbi:lignin-forming anionic peroxidase-like [Euphorbia lathyris]|uniref:lignin-forming anionic peroxidase-like n=1 Tax=Euphorbia lathyris TaxID=212925 RepID=UPI00331310BB
MAYHFSLLTCILLSIILSICSSLKCEAHLHPNFYDKTCPNALSTIRTVIRRAVSAERRMAASLVRLHFHDCFVQGCDGSILLDDTPSMQGEKFARNNNNSVRGFEVIDRAKSEVESVCPGVVSCADIVAVAARDATVAVGGPSWTMKLGRRDSTSASLSLANANLPGFNDPLSSLISRFEGKGLTERDMVALSGAHTIGQAQCSTFRGRIYNATDIDAGFATTRRRQCPADAGNGDTILAPLDLVTPNSFDNNYFRNLIQRKGLLQSDQVLFSGGSTDTIVNEYIRSPSTFNSDFASAMVKMGDIDVLIVPRGEVRRRCNVVN